MWELDYKESWVQKNWCFKLWCWIRLLRIPWAARRSNQSILKEISPGCSLEGLKLKLKLEYFGHLMQRADSFEKTLMLGKIEGRRRRGRQRMRWLGGITDSKDMGLGGILGVGDGQGGLACCGSWGHEVRHDWATELNSTESRILEAYDQLIQLLFILGHRLDSALCQWVEFPLKIMEKLEIPREHFMQRWAR